MTRLGILASHPVQYQAPIWRALAREVELQVYYAHRQTPDGQARAGFGQPFEWDRDLLEGYSSGFLNNVARRPGVDRFLDADTPAITQEIRRGRFDAFVVWGWGLKCFWQAVLACRRRGVPVMVWGDSQLPTPRRWWWRAAKPLLYRRILRAFDAFLVVGQRAREYLLHYGVAPWRLFSVPHCVDTAWFGERSRLGADERAAARAHLGAGPGEALLLFAGKLLPRKRPGDLVRAAALLRERGIGAACAFAGSGPLEPGLRELALRERVPVHMAGFKNQSQMPRYYAAADLLVLPSDGRETWGLVVNEAFACGTAAVVSDAAGCAPDLIREGLTGATYPAGDVPALAEALARVLPLAGTEPVRRALAERSNAHSIENAVTGVLEALAAAREGHAA